MKVTFWGTRGSMPASLNYKAIEQKLAVFKKSSNPPFCATHTYGTATSCVQIDDGSENILICDAGSGIRELGLTHPNGTYHIFLSHLHWDHIQGFPFFAPAFNPNNRIIIHGCHDNIPTALQNQMKPPYFPISMDDMAAKIQYRYHKPGSTFNIDNTQVTIFEQDHPGVSYGYRFENQETGKSVVYSTDSEHKGNGVYDEDYPFFDFIKDTDLLIFDAQYTMAEASDLKENWGHSSNILGIEFALKTGVKHLCLFHMEPTLSDEALDQYLESSQQYLELQCEDSPSDLKISIAYDHQEVIL